MVTSARTLGTVVDITRDGELLVRSAGETRGEDPDPPLGARVVDTRNRDLGRVREVLGPVDAPYLLLEPGADAGSLHRVVGNDVYER